MTSTRRVLAVVDLVQPGRRLEHLDVQLDADLGQVGLVDLAGESPSVLVVSKQSISICVTPASLQQRLGLVQVERIGVPLAASYAGEPGATAATTAWPTPVGCGVDEALAVERVVQRLANPLVVERRR